MLNNPGNKPLKFLWTPDAQNPVSCNITNNHDSTATADIPGAEGIYRFNLIVTAGNDSVWFQTCVTRKEKILHAFDIATEHAEWIDNAVIYQITPTRFVKDADYDDIAAKLPELY